MEWEDFASPLGDPPCSPNYSYAPWGNTAPPSPSAIYIPARLEHCIPSLVSPTADASSIGLSGQLEKLSVDAFVHAPCEDNFGPLRQSRKDIAIFRCGCCRLDRSRWRVSLENDLTNVTRAGKSVAYRWVRPDHNEGFEGRHADIVSWIYSTYDKNCGLCELQHARARHEANRSEEIDEIIKNSKSDKYGDHVHLTTCIRTGAQPRRVASSLADLIAQSEVRQAINQDEYMSTSEGKALNLGVVGTLRDRESSSVQQGPMTLPFRDVMLSNYSADLDGLDESTQYRIDSERKSPGRAWHGHDPVMSAGPEETGYVPKRQNIKGNAISASDLSKRTEEEWEYMSSHEQRCVMLVPLLDACKACEKEGRRKRGKKRKGGSATSLRATDATNDPQAGGGAHDIVEQTSENGVSLEATEAPKAPEPDDAAFLEFTEQTRENTPCMLISEVSNAPESGIQILGQTSDDNLGVPETRDTQTLQHDEVFFEQMSEENIRALGTEYSDTLQHDEVSFEQMEKETTGIEVTNRSDASDVQVLDQMSEDNLREPETRSTHTLQHNGAFERMGESTPWMQAIEGTNAMEPDTHVPEQSIENAPFTSEFPDRIGEPPPRIQGPEGPHGREPYLDILLRCPFSQKLELKAMNEYFATAEPMAQANRQPKPSLASFVDRIDLLKLPPGIYPRQPSTETKLTRQMLLPPQNFAKRVGRKRARRQYPPSQVFLSWSSPRPTVIIPSEIEPLTQNFWPSNSTGGPQQPWSSETRTEGESVLGVPPSQDFIPWDVSGAHRYQRSSDLGIGGNLALDGVRNQDFSPPDFTEARQHQRSSELGMEGNPALGGSPMQDFRPSDFARARGHLRSSDIARPGDARSNEGRSNNFGPVDLTGARQPPLSTIWQLYPHLTDPDLHNVTPFHPAQIHQQQRSAEAGRESNPRWEHPPQDFRPLHSTEVSQQQPSLETGGGDSLQRETRFLHGSTITQSAPIGPPQPSASILREGEPCLRLPPRRDFRPPQPTGGDQRIFPSKPKAYGRDSPLGPPVQAFPPPKPRKDSRQKGNTRDIGAQVQPQSQPEASPSQSSPWLNSKKRSRQGEDSGDMGQQIQTPMRQQGQRQAEIQADTGGRLVPFFAGPSVPSSPPPRLQREADARGPLRETGKQGKAPPPASRPESHRHEASSMSGNNKRSWES